MATGAERRGLRKLQDAADGGRQGWREVGRALEGGAGGAGAAQVGQKLVDAAGLGGVVCRASSARRDTAGGEEARGPNRPQGGAWDGRMVIQGQTKHRRREGAGEWREMDADADAETENILLWLLLLEPMLSDDGAVDWGLEYLVWCRFFGICECGGGGGMGGGYCR